MTERKAFSRPEAIQKAIEIGFPVVVRPLYPLGNCGARECHNEGQLIQHLQAGVFVTANNPILLNKKLT